MVRSRSATLINEVFQECTWRAGVGFDHGFEQETFVLGPGHWITLNLREWTIAYEGTEKRVQMNVATRLGRVLTPRYTQLATGPARTTGRHFIEILTWRPMQASQTWTLMWMLNEVVRDQMIRVASEQLATIVALEPPTNQTFDVRTLVRLAVNDDGHVEWSTLAGDNPRKAVVDSEVDRQEQQESIRLARARAAAEKSIDWSRSLDLNRRPSFNYIDAGSCRRSFMFGWSADRTEAITVYTGDGLTESGARTFDLALPNTSPEVGLRLTEHPSRQWSFCSDVIVGIPQAKWRATKGTVTIDVSPRSVGGRVTTRYRATIRITGAEFVSADGVRARQVQPIVLTVFGQ